MQHFSENCCILGIRHAVSSKVQGTVEVRKFKEVQNLNSTPTLLCNRGSVGRDARGVLVRHRGDQLVRRGVLGRIRGSIAWKNHGCVGGMLQIEKFISIEIGHL